MGQGTPQALVKQYNLKNRKNYSMDKYFKQSPCWRVLEQETMNASQLHSCELKLKKITYLAFKHNLGHSKKILICFSIWVRWLQTDTENMSEHPRWVWMPGVAMSATNPLWTNMEISTNVQRIVNCLLKSIWAKYNLKERCNFFLHKVQGWNAVHKWEIITVGINVEDYLVFHFSGNLQLYKVAQNYRISSVEQSKMWSFKKDV